MYLGNKFGLVSCSTGSWTWRGGTGKVCTTSMDFKRGEKVQELYYSLRW